MAVLPTEPGTLRAVLETLLKPFTLILNPLAERIGKRLKRKPTLHIYVRPHSMIWYACGTYNPMMPMMRAHFLADITNDGNEGVLIVDGYFKRTKSQDPFRERIDIPPGATILGKYINLTVVPVVGDAGKDFTGEVILIDQLRRKHRTDKITFKWI